MKYKIIAVDFDGTLCENKWPEIGALNYELIKYLKKQQSYGDVKLVLWTCRVGSKLDAAIWACLCEGLVFDAVNENLPEVIEEFGGDCRKIFAHEYYDDRMSGRFNLPFETKKGIADHWSKMLEDAEDTLNNKKEYPNFLMQCMNIPFIKTSITDETISKIEAAIGLSLYDWQKDYLKGDDYAVPKSGRGNGKTLAFCLRKLLSSEQPKFKGRECNTKGLDEPYRPGYGVWFRNYIYDLNDKLIEKGFTTNMEE